MKRAKSGSGDRRPPKPLPTVRPQAPATVLAAQRRRLLSKHYINKYRVRRGR